MPEPTRDSTVKLILQEVERLEPTASGAFVVDLGSLSVGTVFVEHNQVCWAAYTGLSRRLRDLLRDHLIQALTEAGDSAKQDGEVRENVKAEAMRRALKDHTIESLLALPQEQGEHIEWVPHRNQGYQPRFTFTPAELLVAVHMRLYSTEAAGVDAALAMIDGVARGASFVQADGGGLLAVQQVGELTIADLDDLGAWADAAFSVTRGFSREVMRHTVDAATSEVAVAWRTSRAQIHAAVIAPGPCLQRLMTMLERGNYPAIISRRANRSSLAVRGGLGAVDSNP